MSLGRRAEGLELRLSAQDIELIRCNICEKLISLGRSSCSDRK